MNSANMSYFGRPGAAILSLLVLGSSVMLDPETARAEAESPRDQASLAEAARQFERAAKLPTELVERRSEVTSLAKQAWAKARSDSDFRAFAPHLSKVLEICHEMADLLGYDDEPYDSLLDAYERNTSTRQVAQTFDALEPGLREISREAVAQSKARGASTRLPSTRHPP